MIHTSKAFDLS